MSDPLLGDEAAPDPDATVRLFAGHGVSGALILSAAGLASACTDHRAENDRIVAYCRRAPEHLFPSLTVNPLTGQAAQDEIRRCRAEHGVRVLKLHPWLQGFSVSSPAMDAVAALCETLGVAIVSHDGTPPYSTPLQLARLCRDFPGLVVLSGHAGLADLWRDAMLAAQRHEHYHLCLCGQSMGAMQTILREVPPEKLCFGSDYFGTETFEDQIWYSWTMFRRLKMSAQTRRIIEEETPKRLLGLA